MTFTQIKQYSPLSLLEGVTAHLQQQKVAFRHYDTNKGQIPVYRAVTEQGTYLSPLGYWLETDYSSDMEGKKVLEILKDHAPEPTIKLFMALEYLYIHVEPKLWPTYLAEMAKELRDYRKVMLVPDYTFYYVDIYFKRYLELDEFYSRVENLIEDKQLAWRIGTNKDKGRIRLCYSRVWSVDDIVDELKPIFNAAAITYMVDNNA